MRALVDKDLEAAFPEAYAQAARAGAEMRAAAEALESVRDALRVGADLFDLWSRFDEQIGRADLDRLVPTLVWLRGEFERAAVSRAAATLAEEFYRDPRAGWSAWIRLYLRSFDERGFRRSFAGGIASGALRWSPSAEWPVERIREAVGKVLRSRWADAYDWFLFLSEQEDLPGPDRAAALCVAAEVQLYHFVRPSQARRLLERAAEIAPGDPSVIRCWGEYWLLVEEPDRARECFERLVRERPDLADGFVGLGDCADKAGDRTAAESYYNQAVTNAPGMRDGYRQLLNWHGKEEWFRHREALVESLFRRLLALSDHEPYTWVELGCVYKQNRRFEDARRCFQKAIELDPACSLAQVWLAYTWLDEAAEADIGTPRGAELLEAARSHFAEAIRTAPDALDGYWGLSGLEMTRGDWAAALRWCEQGLACHPDWEPSLRLRRAHILRQLGRRAEALADIERSIALEPGSPQASEILSDLAGDFLEAGDNNSLSRVLEAARGLQGRAGVAGFANRLGNLYYRAGNFAAAASCYRQAIEATPQDDVLHSNLALALERLREPGRRLDELSEAVAALGRAAELRPDNAAYKTRRADLEAERRFVELYGEEALQLEPYVTPIRVEAGPQILPDILNAEQDALSEATLARIEALRAAIRERYGLTIPGVRFTVLNREGSAGNDYVIRIFDRYEYSGAVEPGGRFLPAPLAPAGIEPPPGLWLKADVTAQAEGEVWTVAGYVLEHLRAVVEHHLVRFAGHQEVSEMLKRSESDSAGEILSRPGELTAFVRTLRLLLERRISVADLARIAAEFVPLRQSGAAPEAIAAWLALQLAPPATSGPAPVTV
ncbi:MAG TPA: tetratricopeptide repeat protein [Bryobacteraceae bacterium]|nr:tetratricopeptide repeat protein [Bryobacteraceae bacterium]